MTSIDDQIKTLHAHVGVLLWGERLDAAHAGAAMQSTIHDHESLNVACAHLASHAALLARHIYAPSLILGGLVQPQLDAVDTPAARAAMQIISAATNGDLPTTAALINSVGLTTHDGADYGHDVYRQLGRFARLFATAVVEEIASEEHTS